MAKTYRIPQGIQKGLVGIFFLVLVIIGLVTVPDYGVPTDEDREMTTLQYNVREYVRLFVGIREADEAYFRSYEVTEPTLGAYTDRVYGSALLYPAAPLLLLEDAQQALRIWLWHGYLFLVFMLGCWALYSMARTLFGSRLLACGGVLLLYLSPLFFAEAHYNSKDTMMMALTLVMLWQGIRLWQKPTAARGLLFALAGAVATNQRVIGLALFGLIALFVVLRCWRRTGFTRQVWTAALVTLVGFLGFYYILTPNAWGKPWMNFPETIATFSRFGWEGYVLFQGTVYAIPQDTLPRTYILFLLGMTTPIPLLVMMGLGQVAAAWGLLQGKKRQQQAEPLTVMLLCSLLWLLPMAYFFIAQPPVYNGWRHYQFLYGPLVLLAVYGLYTLGTLLKPWWWRGILALGVTAYLVWVGVGMAENHPYQFAYYNALAQDAAETEEGDYWFMAVHDTVRTLLRDPDVDPEEPLSISNVGIYRINALSPQERERVEWLPHSDWQSAEFVLVGARKWYAEEDANPFTEDELWEEFDEYLVVESYGNPVMYVYQRYY